MSATAAIAKIEIFNSMGNNYPQGSKYSDYLHFGDNLRRFLPRLPQTIANIVSMTA
jgi:hypothetical protein